MPSNKLIDSLLKDPNDRGGPDGDEVHNLTNDKSVATTPSHDDGYPDIDPQPISAPIPDVDARAVASKCCRRISDLITDGIGYKDAIKRIMCIKFASDSANSVSTGGLAYNIVLPVPANVAFPRKVLPSAHEILKYINALSNDDVIRAIDESILQSMSIIDHNHMLLQGNYKNTTTLYRVMIPSPPPVYDIQNYRNGFFIATTVAFCLPLVWRIRDVTTEIGSGLKELQETMGLSSSVFWIGHFLSAWFVCGVEAAFAILVTIVIPEKYEPPEKYEDASVSNETREKERKSFDSIYNRVYQDIPESTRYLQNPDGSLVVACFATFVTCHTLLALLIACAFPLGRWPMVVAFVLFFILPFCDGENMSFLFGASLFSYVTDKRKDKLRAALYPNVALGRIIKIIGIYDDFEGTAGWDIIGKRALNLDNVTIVELWIIFLTTTFILAILIAYLSNVLPWTTSRPQPLLFPVMRTYWFPRTLKVTGTEINENGNAARFEPLPELDVVIECKNLVKVFGGTVALNNLNMTTYNSQATILLGTQWSGEDNADEHTHRFDRTGQRISGSFW
ncbi:hypothetical protein MTO96_035918 [Rhipicephalus appendiculatus]